MRDARGSCGVMATSRRRSGRGRSGARRQRAVRGARESLASGRGETARRGAPGTEDGLRGLQRDLLRDLREETDPGQGSPHRGNWGEAAPT